MEVPLMKPDRRKDSTSPQEVKSGPERQLIANTLNDGIRTSTIGCRENNAIYVILTEL
jgi:hypothetical protein